MKQEVAENRNFSSNHFRKVTSFFTTFLVAFFVFFFFCTSVVFLPVSSVTVSVLVVIGLASSLSKAGIWNSIFCKTFAQNKIYLRLHIKRHHIPRYKSKNKRKSFIM